MELFDGYILDLDGTVYRGGNPIPGAAETIARLRKRGAKVAFLSNNPSKSVEQYIAKLSGLGVPVTAHEIVTSGETLIAELKKESPGAKLVTVCEPLLQSQLRAAGFQIAERPEDAAFVILAFDRTFHYGKLAAAHNAVKAGARIWATNPDRACPTEDGDTPDCAAIIAALEACSGGKLERCVGKPSPAILKEATRRIGVPLERCLMIGDRLETDIRMAREAGVKSALVLTGATPRNALQHSALQPDYVLQSVAELG